MTSALEEDLRSIEYSSFLRPMVRRRTTSSLPVGKRESLECWKDFIRRRSFRIVQ
jgi:hypothetical protein